MHWQYSGQLYTGHSLSRHWSIRNLRFSEQYEIVILRTLAACHNVGICFYPLSLTIPLLYTCLNLHLCLFFHLYLRYFLARLLLTCQLVVSHCLHLPLLYSTFIFIFILSLSRFLFLSSYQFLLFSTFQACCQFKSWLNLPWNLGLGPRLISYLLN